MAACAGCGKPYTSEAVLCANCGAKVDRAAAMLEEADELLAQATKMERHADKVIAKQKRDIEHSLRKERNKLRDAVDSARRDAEKERSRPTSVLAAAREVGPFAFVPIFIVFLALHMFVFPAIDRSPAEIVCPLVCHGCSAPARVASWSYKGPWRSANGRMGYAFVCSNPSVDVRRLTDSDISGKRNASLQPYMLNAFAVSVIELAFVLVLSALGWPAVAFFRRRRRLAGLDARLKSAEKELADFEARVASVPETS